MHRAIVRHATTEDLEDLLRFEQGIVSAERPFDRTIQDGSIHYYDIRRMLTSPEVQFVVAESDSRIVACGFARIDAAKPYLKHRLQAYVGLIYVDPAHRGEGLCGKIIDELKRWCRAKDVAEMRLEVYHDNLAAVKAYEKAGFSKHMMEMRICLSDE
jgi:ribosomal protein S18 acetylase RimI-like enzyme